MNAAVRGVHAASTSAPRRRSNHSTWAGARSGGFFLKPDSAVLPALATVSTWASTQSYEPAAVGTFLQRADFYLVAHALAHGHVVVTHEVAAASTRKIKIPNACIEVGVKCMSPFEMLRSERARFVLGQTSGSETHS